MLLRCSSSPRSMPTQSAPSSTKRVSCRLLSSCVGDLLGSPTTRRRGRMSGRQASKDAAQTGAATGREFGFELLATVTDLPEPQLHEALDRLANAGLLFVRGTPPQSNYI